MTPVTGIGIQNAIQSSSSGHGDHGASAAAPNGNTGSSFSASLAQALNQAQVGGTSANGEHTSSHNTGGSAQSGHIPIGGSPHGEEHGFQETALGLRAYRQQLIASNIANADTPNYKAVDIDFQEALRIARSVANISPLSLTNTATGHIAGQAPPPSLPYSVKYHVPIQPSADGNTVEMDVERSKLAENSIMWEFSRDRVSGHFKMMMELFQNLK